MKYFSTRKNGTGGETFSLKQAAFMGLAPDGGLFMPVEIPQVAMGEVTERARSSFADMAEYLAGLFFAGDVPSGELRAVTREAFDFPVPLYNIGAGFSTLELFHGPTAAFKDFGAGFMGRMLGRLRTGDEKLTILTATSGDTGSAVAYGFFGVPGIEVVVLYPDGKISDLQESQMTTPGGNIHALRVAGTFDDCQRMVKEVFNDADFRTRHNITSANSINLLRWIPQSFYYFWGVVQWMSEHKTAPGIVVPSGNYGNLSAGMLARRMGLPIARFVAASNANDVIPKFLQTGVYTPRSSVRTVANAMDVGAPSNYERMMALCRNADGGSNDTIGALRKEVIGFSASDEQIRGAIKEMYDRFGYISDPHSAVGYLAAKHYGTGGYTGSNDPKASSRSDVSDGLGGFWLSTAAAAKFGEVIEPVLGVAPAVPERLAVLLGRPKISTPMAPDADKLKDFVASL